MGKEDETLTEDHQALMKSDIPDDLAEEHDETAGITPATGLGSLIGTSGEDVIAKLGEPDRRDPSLHDYDWWIYNIHFNQYIQVGIFNNKVVTVFATGDEANVAPFYIGQAANEIYTTIFADTNVLVDYNESSYRFELSEGDLHSRPLVKLGDMFAILHIDTFTQKLSSVRFMDRDTLIKLRPFEMTYRGELPETEVVSSEKEKEAETGKERQIFDITNVIRVRHGLQPLEWDGEVSEVALAHSVDMYESNQFSHRSDKYGELSDRLKAADIIYLSAGENIAANYVDAPAVVEGWVNSKGHRASLLNEQFTHLGVGVFKKHYTQNFIEKWEAP